MRYSLTSAAATSSCVESGFEAHSTRLAPPAFNVMARLAVSAVICRQPDIRTPFKGWSFSKRSWIRRSTGISLAAHPMRSLPRAANEMSLTSPLIEVVINNLFPSFERISSYVISLPGLSYHRLYLSGLTETPIRIEVRTRDEALVTFCNVIHYESSQPANAEVFAHKRAKNVSMHDTELDLVNTVAATSLWLDRRKVAKQTTCECIARACGIDNLFERIRRCTKEGAISPKEQCSVASLLDHHVP